MNLPWSTIMIEVVVFRSSTDSYVRWNETWTVSAWEDDKAIEFRAETILKKFSRDWNKITFNPIEL